MGERHPVRRSNPSCTTLTIFRQRTTTATERRETEPPRGTPLRSLGGWSYGTAATAGALPGGDARAGGPPDPATNFPSRRRSPAAAETHPRHATETESRASERGHPEAAGAPPAAAPGPQHRWPRPPAGTTVSPGRERRARAGPRGIESRDVGRSRWYRTLARLGP